ncbi:MAG: hypothetical protein AAFY60_08600, partial [Myxococcota bacterium]
QAYELLQRLNDIQPSLVASDFARAVPYLLSHRRRALVLLMTDLYDPDVAVELADASRRLMSQHVPMALLIRDPVAERIRDHAIESERDAYQRAAAELLLEDRHAALARVRAGGLPVADIEMGQVGAHTVELYLAARDGAAW